MDSILCDVISLDTALAAGIGAGVVAGAKGVQLLGAHMRRRNGGCNGKPGYTEACVKHLQRLAKVEEALVGVRDALRELRDEVKELRR